MLSIKENVYKYLLPNLLEIQRISFCWFLEKGLVQEFEDFFFNTGLSRRT